MSGFLNDSLAADRAAAGSPAGRAAAFDLEAEFSRLYLQHARQVRCFFLRRHLPLQVAEDLAQDVFIRAYRAFANFEKRGIAASEAAWLSKIALHTWYNWHRDNKGEPILLLDEADEEHPFDPPDHKAVDSRQRLIEADIRAAIPGLLREMPPGQREVLALWLEGKSYEEICRLSGKSLQNVRATLHKAKEKLMELLRQRDLPRQGSS